MDSRIQEQKEHTFRHKNIRKQEPEFYNLAFYDLPLPVHESAQY
jgi:hypothetical protein